MNWSEIVPTEPGRYVRYTRFQNKMMCLVTVFIEDDGELHLGLIGGSCPKLVNVSKGFLWFGPLPDPNEFEKEIKKVTENRNGRGIAAGSNMADILMEWLHLKYNKKTALRMLNALIKRLEEGRDEFE